jgi:hypothetical protein
VSVCLSVCVFVCVCVCTVTCEKRPERPNVFGDQGPAGRCTLSHVECPLAVASTDKAVDTRQSGRYTRSCFKKTRGLFKCMPVFFFACLFFLIGGPGQFFVRIYTQARAHAGADNMPNP